MQSIVSMTVLAAHFGFADAIRIQDGESPWWDKHYSPSNHIRSDNKRAYISANDGDVSCWEGFQLVTTGSSPDWVENCIAYDPCDDDYTKTYGGDDDKIGQGKNISRYRWEHQWDTCDHQ